MMNYPVTVITSGRTQMLRMNVVWIMVTAILTIRIIIFMTLIHNYFCGC